jgi:nucleoid-associated protein YejK
VLQIVETYTNRTSQRTGRFGDISQHQFPARLTNLVDGQDDFFSFTLWALENLRIAMEGVWFATGGYLFICDYTAQTNERFFLARMFHKPTATTGSLPMKRLRWPVLRSL